MQKNSAIIKLLGLKSLGIAVALLAAAILYYVYQPGKGSLFPTCPFHAVTGIFCPGCGSQRAIHHLLHLRITTAAGFNLLAVIYIPLLIMHYLSVVLQKAGLSWQFNLFRNRYFTYATLVVVIVFWLLRNIPFMPFQHLAPT